MCNYCKVSSFSEDLKFTARYSSKGVEIEGCLSKDFFDRATKDCTGLDSSISVDKDGKIHILLKPIEKENV